jgi:hypothetical protein
LSSDLQGRACGARPGHIFLREERAETEALTLEFANNGPLGNCFLIGYTYRWETPDDWSPTNTVQKRETTPEGEYEKNECDKNSNQHPLHFGLPFLTRRPL